jgi:putative endonuclease
MWVYILKSIKTGFFYTGQTIDLIRRLEEHNSGKTGSIKAGIPWELVWSKEVDDRSAAVILENLIKSRGAKRFLDGL